MLLKWARSLSILFFHVKRNLIMKIESSMEKI